MAVRHRRVIQSYRVCQLSEQQTDHMTPIGEPARFLICARLPGEPGNEMPGNEVANLLEDTVMSGGWRFYCFHTRRAAVNENSIQPFFSFFRGMAVKRIQHESEDQTGVEAKMSQNSSEVFIVPNWLRLAVCYWIQVGIVWIILRYFLIKELLPTNARNVFFGMAVLFAVILVILFHLFFRTSIRANTIEQGIIMRRRINAEHVDAVRRSLFSALVTSRGDYPILLLSPFFIKNQRDVCAALTKAAKGNEAMINFAKALSD